LTTRQEKRKGDRARFVEPPNSFLGASDERVRLMEAL